MDETGPHGTARDRLGQLAAHKTVLLETRKRAGWPPGPAWSPRVTTPSSAPTTPRESPSGCGTFRRCGRLRARSPASRPALRSKEAPRSWTGRWLSTPGRCWRADTAAAWAAVTKDRIIAAATDLFGRQATRQRRWHNSRPRRACPAGPGACTAISPASAPGSKRVCAVRLRRAASSSPSSRIRSSSPASRRGSGCVPWQRQGFDLGSQATQSTPPSRDGRVLPGLQAHLREQVLDQGLELGRRELHEVRPLVEL